MNMNLDSDSFDVVVLGTGLAQSIAAAALAKAGRSVLHLDPNEYYGGEQASLTLDELQAWAAERSSSSSFSSPASPYTTSQRTTYSHASTTPLTPALQADRRRYALSLFPSLMPSRGTLINTLITSDVSKYVEFKLLAGVHIAAADESGFQRVPGSKEDVFKDKSISLPEKRKLMKALLFAGGEFEADPLFAGKEDEALLALLKGAFGLSDKLAQAIAYALAFAGEGEPAAPALRRARRYLRSMGRYGPSPFLLGQYGGAGEVAQGFCRACAVFGGTYILGSEGAPTAIEPGPDSVTLRIPAHPTPITARHVLTPPGFLEPAPATVRTSAHLIAVVTSQPPVLRKPRREGEDDDYELLDDDTAVIVFPPAGDAPLVRALVCGEGAGVCPRGQWVVYLAADVKGVDANSDPKALLEPYLTRIAEGVAFEAAYFQHHPEPEASEEPEAEPESEGEGEDEAEAEAGEGAASAVSAKAGGDAAPSPPAPPPAAPTAPLVILRPYTGAHTLTEGLDHEAREGARAFAAVCSEPFFPAAEEEEDEDDE